MAKRQTKGSTGKGGAVYEPPKPAPMPMFTLTIETPVRAAHSYEVGITIQAALDGIRAEFGADHWTCISMTLTAIGQGGEKEWLIDENGLRVPRRTVEAYLFGADETDLHSEEGVRQYADTTTGNTKEPGRQPPRQNRSKGNPVNHPRPR